MTIGLGEGGRGGGSFGRCKFRPATLPPDPRPVDRWNAQSLADTFLVGDEGRNTKDDILNCLCNGVSILWEMQWIMGVE
jgi:hypothetical protein